MACIGGGAVLKDVEHMLAIRRHLYWIAAGLLLLALAVGPASAEGDFLAVVVAAERPLEAVDPETLTLIYLRKKQFWRDGRRIQPVNFPVEHPARRQFSGTVLNQSSVTLADYWNEQYFHGVLPPHVVQSTAAMLRFVAQTNGAVGYLPYCEVPRSLRILLVQTPDGQLRQPSAVDITCPPSLPDSRDQ
jgi:ABC-type phosphate transport system substrate-binding protein